VRVCIYMTGILAQKLLIEPLFRIDPLTAIGPFQIGNLFRNKNIEIFLLKVSTFTLQIYFRKGYVNYIVDASFDVCKHWPIDQSQHLISDISSTEFHKIEHILNGEIEF